MPRDIQVIVIHCSATESGKPLRTAHESAAEVIDRMHQARGFRRERAAVLAFSTSLPHIGYHYVIDVDGVAINGRHPDELGAHAQGFNEQSLGICLVGGVEKTGRYTSAQWKSLADLVRAMCGRHGVPVQKAYSGMPRGICGHRDLSVDLNGDGVITPQEWLKTCPGFSVQEWLNNAMVPLPQHIYTKVPV